MSRRAHTGSWVGGSAASAWAGMTGVTSLSVANYYSVAGGEDGTASGFGVFALITVLSQSVASNPRVLAGKFGGGGGWTIDTTTTNATLRFNATNGAGSSISSPAYTIQASDVGKVLGVCGYHDGTSVRLYVNRVEVGSGTAIVGYTASASATVIGHLGGSYGADNIAIYGLTSWQGTRTLKQIRALFDDAKLLRDVPGGNTTHAWSFKRSGVVATVADLSGTDDLARTASPTAYSVYPTFGW